MIIKYINVQCSMCEKVSSQKKVLSYSTLGTPNLDLKPNGSITSIASSLNKCPYCHYTNYDISQTKALKGFLEELEYKEIVNNKNLSEDAIKAMLMQYITNYFRDYNESYKWAIRSSWTLEDINEKEMANRYKEKATDIFFNSIFIKNLTMLTQAIDTARQIKKFDFSSKMANNTKKLLELCDNLVEKEKHQIKVLKYIEELCINKDSDKHNILESYENEVN